jgi:UDP-N-acetylmuramoyl-tripeptide--D-alanyl-D-alanine ligase
MLFPFLIFLLPFWFLRDVKQILFWVYLWQLKQYHRGRFFDHFKTEKGKKLLFQPLQILKIILLVLFFAVFLLSNPVYLAFFPLILFLAYFLESLLYFKAIFAKRAKNPVFTKKTIVLVFVSLLAVVLYPFLISSFTKDFILFSLALLIFDILLPLIVSLIVIIIQPLADYNRLSLQKRAKEKMSAFSKKNLTIIAIAGSYGKTSTKEYLTTILSQKFKVLATKDHQNTEVGIPQTILNELNPSHEVFIVEMGAYDKGTIKRICDFLGPEIGIVTGVNSQHLALFGSMENLLSAEGGQELLNCLPKDGLLITNSENNYCRDLYEKAKIKKISYSFKDAENIKTEKDFVSFSLRKDNTNFKVGVPGKHNILNLLAAISVAKELGMATAEIAKASRKITDKQSSYKISRNKEGFNIINSTYSANPDGAIADLDYLKVFSGKKIIVMACLIELGKTAKEVHQKIGRKIAEVCDLAIITGSDCYPDIKKAAIESGMKKEDIELISDPNLIHGRINSLSCKDGSILLEGRLSEVIIKKLSL